MGMLRKNRTALVPCRALHILLFGGMVNAYNRYKRNREGGGFPEVA